MRRPRIPSVDEAVEAMNWPTEDWRGQCYAVAAKMVRAGLVEGRAVYGYYTGPIDPDSDPFGSRRHLPFVHHGWIVTPDGWIVDPTRWVFENTKPRIHAFEPDQCEDFDPDEDGMVCRTCDHVVDEHARSGFFKPCDFSGLEYDEGGNCWREENCPPRPASTPEERTIALFLPPIGPYSGEALRQVIHLLDRPDLDGYASPLHVSLAEVFWLANLSVHSFGPSAGVVYDCLEAAGHGAAIPIDNKRMVEATVG